MKKVLLSIMLMVFVIPDIWAIEPPKIIEPPKKLKWNMTYNEVKTHLEKTLEKDKRLKVDKLKESKAFVDGFRKAQLKKVKLFKKKAQNAYAVFDNKDRLCAVYYIFRWSNDEKEETVFDTKGKGRSKCWAFQQSLVEALTAKYGKPVSDETLGKRGEVIGNGVRFEVKWVDDLSEEVIVAITRSTKNMLIGRLDDYYVILVYQNEQGKKAERATATASDDL